MIHISQESRDCLMRIGNIAYVLVRTVRMERRVGCRVRLFAGILWSSVFTAALPRLFGGGPCPKSWPLLSRHCRGVAAATFCRRADTIFIRQATAEHDTAPPRATLRTAAAVCVARPTL